MKFVCPSSPSCHLAFAFYKFQTGPARQDARNYVRCGNMEISTESPGGLRAPAPMLDVDAVVVRVILRRDIPFAASPRLSERSPWTGRRTSVRWRGPENQNHVPRAGGRDFDFVLGTGTRGARRETRVAISPSSLGASSPHTLNGAVYPAARRREFSDTPPTADYLQRSQLRTSPAIAACAVARVGPPRVVKTQSVKLQSIWLPCQAVKSARTRVCGWSERQPGSTSKVCFVRSARSWVQYSWVQRTQTRSGTPNRDAMLHGCVPGQMRRRVLSEGTSESSNPGAHLTFIACVHVHVFVDLGPALKIAWQKGASGSCMSDEENVTTTLQAPWQQHARGREAARPVLS